MEQVLGMMKSAAAGEGRLPTEVVSRVFHRMRSEAKSKQHGRLRGNAAAHASLVMIAQ